MSPLANPHGLLQNRPAIPSRDGREQRPVYHYTTGDRMLGILGDRLIQVAHANVEPPEIPAVWFSTAGDWERSATKGVIIDGRRRQATLDELVSICGCLVRIQIDPDQVALIAPFDMRRKLRIPQPVFTRLIEAGMEMGADPMQWRAVASPVPLSAILQVETACGLLRWTPLVPRDSEHGTTILQGSA